ncbi:MAG TPA: glutathione S-transferase family protein [Pseudomonadales bacterium]|nr:glutathione S-transferase family protein [Pseudomonadales bacterium]
MALRLYDHPLSPYGQKVKIALIEKGVPFQAMLPNAIGSGQVDDSFAAANPRGEVPALIDGDAAIFDSTVIIEYIEDKWPKPALLPATPLDRARVRMLEDVMDTHFEGITWGLSEVRNFGRAEGTLAERLEASAATELARWYEWLGRQLGSRKWFNGDAFGWGDLCVVPFVNGATSFGHRPAADSALADWLVRANARDSVKQVSAEAAKMAMQGASAGMQAVRQALQAGLFKREYRDHRLEWMVRNGAIEVVQTGLERRNIRFTESFGR